MDSCVALEDFDDFFDRVDHSRSRSRASHPSCVTVYPRGSRSRVFQLVLTLVKNLYDLLNCIPVAGGDRNTQELLDLAEGS
jgi:hypothetical protein